MNKDSGCLVVDRDDLENKIWTCAKYKSLHDRCSDFCSSVFDSSLKFRVHVRKHHRNPFPSKFSCPVTDCNESSKKYTRIQYLQNHYDCVHRQSRDYRCHVCTKTFSSQKTCTRHVKNCTAGTLNCQYCSKSFTGYTTLSRHCRTLHLEEINKEKVSECQDDSKDSSVKYLLVPLQNVVVQTSESNLSCSRSPEPIPRQSQSCQYTTQATKRLKQNPVQQAWQNALTQTSSPWHSEFQNPTKDCRTTLSSHEPQNSFSVEFEDGLRDKELFSAMENIHGHTQTEEYWGFNEFSTQTASPAGTEQSSFGTQTRCPNTDLLESFMGSEHCDLVEFLDSEVQTENLNQADSSSFASQTNLSTDIESVTNDRGCGIDRSDRDCQTYFYKNSTHTQTKLRKERSLIVVDGLNTQTQTSSLDQMSSVYYNESFTQTISDNDFL